MRIGILTFHSAYNFGAVLQCYALFATIKSLGYNVEVIDYKPSYLASMRETYKRHTFINRTPWLLFDRIKSIKNSQKFYDLFHDFIRREITLSQSCFNPVNLKQVIKGYDHVVIGSDQVWNKKFNGSDSSWYGWDGDSREVRWTGYAVSAGKCDFSKDELTNMQILLEKFNAIGTREAELAKIIKNIYSGNVNLVLDPTLLAHPNIWHKWFSPIIDGDYILTYQARECDDVFRVAKDLSHQLNANKIIPVDFFQNVLVNGFETYICSPPDFVSLIKNAKCVVTTSFHGTALSLIANTPFYTLKLDDGADGRSLNLLESVGLKERFIAKDCSPVFSPIDFTEVNEKLDILRKYSLDFLEVALK